MVRMVTSPTRLWSGGIRGLLESNYLRGPALIGLCGLRLDGLVSLGCPGAGGLVGNDLIQFKSVQVSIDAHIPVLTAGSLVLACLGLGKRPAWCIDHHRTGLAPNRRRRARMQVKTSNSRKTERLLEWRGITGYYRSLGEGCTRGVVVGSHDIL